MLKRRVKLLLVRAILVFLFPVCVEGSLSSQIDGIIGKSEQKKTTFAVKIVQADTGRTVYARNSEKPMIPASNMKVITSAAALAYLGPDYQFTTRIALLGDDLVVIGGGDPLLGDEATDERYDRAKGWLFDDIIAVLARAGVKTVDDVVVDSSFFDDDRVHPNWPRDQLNQWYACEVAGINFNHNCINLNVKRSGSSARVTLEPSTRYVTIVNQVRLVSKGSSAVGAYRNSEANRLIVKGNCRTEAGFDVAIERPAAYFGFLLAERLAGAGIRVEGDLAERYVRDEGKIRILKTYTTPMGDVLNRCNKDSMGLAAESLIKTISAEATTGRVNGQWAHGLELVAAYLEMVGAGADEFNLDDGSGLSRENRLSPNTLVKVLQQVYGGPNWDFYKQTLAVGGQDGTIAKYFGETKYKGNILGKTGYIDGVRAFSGVAATANGDYIFSILTEGGNGYTRSAINDITKAIIDSAD